MEVENGLLEDYFPLRTEGFPLPYLPFHVSDPSADGTLPTLL